MKQETGRKVPQEGNAKEETIRIEPTVGYKFGIQEQINFSVKEMK